MNFNASIFSIYCCFYRIFKTKFIITILMLIGHISTIIKLVMLPELYHGKLGQCQNIFKNVDISSIWEASGRHLGGLWSQLGGISFFLSQAFDTADSLGWKASQTGLNKQIDGCPQWNPKVPLIC